MKDRISEGDIVHVITDDPGQWELNMKVLHVACDTGDSWHLKREDGTIVYVQNFTKMIKNMELSP